MKEKLIIENFGPIKNIDLDLGKITVLIGEQATGKSTVAKVLAICRYFSYITDDSNDILNYQGSFVNTALKDWGLEEFLQDDSSWFYENLDYSLEVKRELNLKATIGNKELEYTPANVFKPQLTPKSNQFKKLLSEFEELKPKNEGLLGLVSEWRIPTSFLANQVKSIMNNPFYFPTERGLQSIFSLGKSSIQNLSDSLFNQFALLDNISKNFKSEIEIEPLDISYKNENGSGYVKKKNEDVFYKLSNGASGYQTSIPIVLGIKFYTEIDKRKRTFIVEEPEINLFPSTQKKLMAYFIKNVNNNKHSFIIPTHSPYFLSAINDYLIAYKKGKLNESETSKIINKDYWLNIDDISCYQLKNGEAYNIIDKKSGLISDNIIDDVSDEMNDEFENLLDIR